MPGSHRSLVFAMGVGRQYTPGSVRRVSKESSLSRRRLGRLHPRMLFDPRAPPPDRYHRSLLSSSELLLSRLGRLGQCARQWPSQWPPLATTRVSGLPRLFPGNAENTVSRQAGCPRQAGVAHRGRWPKASASVLWPESLKTIPTPPFFGASSLSCADSRVTPQPGRACPYAQALFPLSERSIEGVQEFVHLPARSTAAAR